MPRKSLHITSRVHEMLLQSNRLELANILDAKGREKLVIHTDGDSTFVTLHPDTKVAIAPID